MDEFRVIGIDRESGFDTELVVLAADKVHAKAHAESKGVVVTSIWAKGERLRMYLLRGGIVAGVFVVLWIVIANQFGDPPNAKTDVSSRSEAKPDVPPVPSTGGNSKPWYVGGTLHRSTMREWNEATSHNQLATCGDIIVTMYPSLTLSQIKRRAQQLQRGMSFAVRPGESAEQFKVDEVAVLLMLGLDANNEWKD